MVAYVESPAGWAPRQILLTRLERELGYPVTVAGAGGYWRLYLSDVSA
jgi:hypothetical protein